MVTGAPLLFRKWITDGTLPFRSARFNHTWMQARTHTHEKSKREDAAVIIPKEASPVGIYAASLASDVLTLAATIESERICQELL